MTTNKNDIDRYLSGNKKGKEANKLEKEALKDPFLAEAMEGYESFGDNMSEDLNEIVARLATKQTKVSESIPHTNTKHRRNIFLWALPLAAAVVGLVLFILPSENKIQVSDDLVISMDIIEPIDIFVPQDLNDKLQKNTSIKMGDATYIMSKSDTLLITTQSVTIDILMPSN